MRFHQLFSTPSAEKRLGLIIVTGIDASIINSLSMVRLEIVSMRCLGPTGGLVLVAPSKDPFADEKARSRPTAQNRMETYHITAQTRLKDIDNIEASATSRSQALGPAGFIMPRDLPPPTSAALVDLLATLRDNYELASRPDSLITPWLTADFKMDSPLLNEIEQRLNEAHFVPGRVSSTLR